jgi:hypothetical protein
MAPATKPTCLPSAVVVPPVVVVFVGPLLEEGVEGEVGARGGRGVMPKARRNRSLTKRLVWSSCMTEPQKKRKERPAGKRQLMRNPIEGSTHFIISTMVGLVPDEAPASSLS